MSKLKRSYGKGKKLRKNFRFTEQIIGMIEDTAERTGMSENELVSTCIFDILSDNTKFINCPVCNQYIMYKSILPLTEGIAEFDCKCGTHIWYDAETDKILKHKK